MKTINLNLWEQKTSDYAFDGITKRCEFSLCSGEKGTWTQQTPELKCRDSLLLGYFCSKYNLLMEENSLNDVLLDRGFMGLNRLRMTITVNNKERLWKWLYLIHSIESKIGVARTKLYSVSINGNLSDDKIAISAPRFWLKSSVILSLYTLIVRCLISIDNSQSTEGISSLADLLNGTILYGDNKKYLKSFVSNIDQDLFFENINKIFHSSLGILGHGKGEKYNLVQHNFDFPEERYHTGIFSLDESCYFGINSFSKLPVFDLVNGALWCNKYRELLYSKTKEKHE